MLKKSLWGKAAVTCLFALSLTAVYSKSFRASQQAMDFRDYYSAARAVLAGQGHRLYDPALFQSFQEKYFHSPGHFFIAPPATTIFYLPVAVVTASRAYFLWTLGSLVVFCACAFLLNRVTRLRGDGFDFFLLMLMFLPLHFVLLQGQIDSFVLLAYALTLSAFTSGRPFLAGLALAIGLVKFPMVLPFAAIMILRRQWNFTLGMLCGSTLFVAMCAIISGPHFPIDYYRFVEGLGTGGATGIDPRAMPTLRGLYALVASREPSGVLYLSCTALLLFLCSRIPSRIELWFSTAIIATILVSYYMNPHGLVLLIIPLSLLWKLIQWKSFAGIFYFALATPILPLLALRWHTLALMALPLLFLFATLIRKGSSQGIGLVTDLRE